MRRTQGRLFKRGGVYLVRWQYDGKDYRKSTGFRNLRKATAAAETILAPFRQKTKVEALAQLQSRVDRETTVMAEIEDATNPPLSIAQAWSAYVESPETLKGWRVTLPPGAGKAAAAAARGKVSLSAILQQYWWWWMVLGGLAALMLEMTLAELKRERV